ncbi:MAG: PRC-barrel domain-containing protein [Thermoanaerobaculia bacterium]
MNDDRKPTGRLDEAMPGGSVVPLRRLHNFRISEGDPDVRGWEVMGADGRRIGEVDDLLVDSEALRVRYLDVILDPRLLAGPGEGAESPGPIPGPEVGGAPGFVPNATAAMGGLAPMISEAIVRGTLSPTENALTREESSGSGDRHVLISLSQARMDPGHSRVLLEGLPSSRAAGLPIYDGEAVEEDAALPLRDR